MPTTLHHKKILHMRLLCLLVGLFGYYATAHAQQGNWHAQLERNDGNNIVFTFEWKTENGRPVWYIKNAAEKLRVDNIKAIGDSFFVQMPVFESQIRFAVKDGKLDGEWLKRGAVKTQVLPFTATRGNDRFVSMGNAQKNISGRWAITFENNKTGEISVGEFVQNGNLVTGTFLNASGDYRYQEGIVTNDTLLLSGFDGGHAFLFKANIVNDSIITNGVFYSGAINKETWSAVKDNNAKVPEETVAMYAKTRSGQPEFFI